jgi:hypothetical protein
MTIAKKRTTATAIATFLLLTIAVTLVALPLANAHDPPQEVPTWTYVAVTPLTIGVNQPVIIVFWQNFVPPTANGNYGDRWTFYVNVTAPDGTNATLGPFVSDPVGSGWTLYTPTQVGTYTAQAWFIGKTLDNTPNGLNPTGTYSGSMMGNINNWLGDYWLPSTSEPQEFTVQQEPMNYYEETPLPSGYWTRPVYGANRDWWSIMGQWLGGATNPGRINDYTEGPESSHILWARPVWLGGVMGGQVGESSIQREYYTGQSYESYGGPSLIVDGKIFYSVGQPPAYGWYCVDLYTGKTIYYENNTDGHHAMPSKGQILNIDNPNQHGGFAYLWRTSGVVLEDPDSSSRSGTQTWELLDAYTGNMICRVGNVSGPAGFGFFFGPVSGPTEFVDTIGSDCYLNIQNLGSTSNPDYYMTVWNSTNAIYNGTTSSFGVTYWSWRPTGSGTHAGRTYATGFDGDLGFTLNASIPAVQGTIRKIVYTLDEKYVIGGTTGNITTNPGQNTKGNFWCLSLKPGEEGRLLWNFTFTPPPGLGDAAIQSIQFSGHDTVFVGVDTDSGVFSYMNSMLRTRWVYSLDEAKTGQPQGTLLWTSEPEDQFNFYGWSTSIYRGRLYSYGTAGVLIAYNVTTGHVDWNWSAPYLGVDETPWEHTPLSLAFIADGKIYLYSSEHSPTMPLRRDGKIYCVDAETGQMLWSITCWPSSSPIISDGRIIAYDLQDGMIYCYGKGNSATTVSAPQTVPALGSSVVITGTVTDETDTGRLNTNAAGASQFNSLDVPVSGDYDFTLKGTPAIGDDSMDAWMEYMYHQRPMPTNATGVEVSLDTIDPNGNYVHIATVTSDSSGNYGYAYTPDVPGTYQIIATFAGSAAYGPSSATTYLSVGEAPPATAAPPEYPQPIDYTMTIIGAAVVLLIAIAIVGILLFRKK